MPVRIVFASMKKLKLCFKEHTFISLGASRILQALAKDDLLGASWNRNYSLKIVLLFYE